MFFTMFLCSFYILDEQASPLSLILQLKLLYHTGEEERLQPIRKNGCAHYREGKSIINQSSIDYPGVQINKSKMHVTVSFKSCSTVGFSSSFTTMKRFFCWSCIKSSDAMETKYFHVSKFTLIKAYHCNGVNVKWDVIQICTHDPDLQAVQTMLRTLA